MCWVVWQERHSALAASNNEADAKLRAATSRAQLLEDELAAMKSAVQVALGFEGGLGHSRFMCVLEKLYKLLYAGHKDLVQRTCALFTICRLRRRHWWMRRSAALLCSRT